MDKYNYYEDRAIGGNGVKLNLGCGNKIMDGFLNIDNRIDIKGVEYPGCDITNLHMFKDESVDYIYACHVLEHISRKKTFATLSEWNRILKYGGLIRVAVPDWESVVKYYIQTKDLSFITNWIYGGREDEKLNEYSHKRIFDYNTLSALMYESGFKRFSRYNPFSTEHNEVDDFSMAYYPHKDFVNGMCMSLNIEATK